jgi:hypothetical protein
MPVDNALDDCKAEPSARDVQFLSLGRAKEALENLILVVGRNSDTGIANDEYRVLALAANAYIDASAARRSASYESPAAGWTAIPTEALMRSWSPSTSNG